jgi:hypothetical protein
LDCRSLANIVVRLDQEEESVQLVPEAIQGTASTKQKLLKRMIPVNYQRCRRN